MNYKLGKLPAVFDRRTLNLKMVLKELPPIPTSYNRDSIFPFEIPTPMFANDKWGDCVIAARAHQTLRFEGYEQSKVIPISDDDVLKEYWKEGGANCWNKKPDRGLVLLWSLRSWRLGWKAGGRKYKIYAFGELLVNDYEHIRASIYLLGGANAGLVLPESAIAQFENGKPWDIVTQEYDRLLGGHAIYLVGYNELGPICMTWAKRQQMTWSFWSKYADECYGIVDDRNTTQSIVDVEKLDAYLQEIEK